MYRVKVDVPPEREANALERLEVDVARLAARGVASPLFARGALRAAAGGLVGAAVTDHGARATLCDAVLLTRFRCGARDGVLAVVAAGNYKDEGCGAAAGAIVREFHEAFADPLPADVDVAPALRRAMLRAHDAIVEIGASPIGDRRLATVMAMRSSMRGIGAAVTAAAAVGDRVFTAHVGDSSAELVRGGRARKLTTPHTPVYDPAFREALRAAGAEASDHHKHIVLRVLGVTAACPAFDVARAELRLGDRLVLSNAPLGDDAAMATALRESASLDAPAAIDALARAAWRHRRWAPATLALLDVLDS